MGLVLLKVVLAGLFLLQADMTSKLSNKSEIFFIRIIPSNHKSYRKPYKLCEFAIICLHFNTN